MKLNTIKTTLRFSYAPIIALLGLLLTLSACSENNAQELEQDRKAALAQKREAIQQILEKYELERIVSISDELRKFEDKSVEEYEEGIKAFLKEHKEHIARQREQLQKEDRMAEVYPEYIEKIRNAQSEEERRAINKEYADVLNITIVSEEGSD